MASLAGLGAAAGAAQGRSVEYGYWEPTTVSGFGSMFQWMQGERPEGAATNRFLSPENFSAQARRVAAGYTYANRGTGYNSYDVTKGGEILNNLKTVGTTAGTAATLRQLKGEGLSMMQRMKAFGVLRLLGDVAMAAGAFEVGYMIGGKIADFFGLGQSTEPAPPPNPTKWEAFKVTYYIDGEMRNGSDVVGATEPQGVILWKPLEGGGSTAYNETFAPGETNCEAKGGETSPPAFAVKYPGNLYWSKTRNVTCAVGTKEAGKVKSSGLWVIPMEVSCLPEEAGCTPSKTTNGGSMPGAKTATETQKDAEECLEGRTCRMVPGSWWNHDPEVQTATVVIPGKGMDIEPADPMLVRVPVPLTHETYLAYNKRLEALELVPQATAVSETATNPAYGPEEVIGTTPSSKTQVKPGTTVKVRYNPSTAPEATGAPGAGWAPPAIPAINLGPLTETGLGCSVFPFGLPCYMKDVVTSLNVSPACPKWDLPLYGGNDIHLDSCVLEPVLNIWRPVFLALASIGIVMMFAGMAGLRGAE